MWKFCGVSLWKTFWPPNPIGGVIALERKCLIANISWCALPCCTVYKNRRLGSVNGWMDGPRSPVGLLGTSEALWAGSNWCRRPYHSPASRFCPPHAICALLLCSVVGSKSSILKTISGLFFMLALLFTSSLPVFTLTIAAILQV